MADKFQDVIAVRVGSEVEILDPATKRYFAATGAKDESFPRLRCPKTSTRRVRVGLTNEEDPVLLLPYHAESEIMGGSVFAHHPRGDHENFAAGQFHALRLAFFQNAKFEHLVQL